jgi:hypothetical protein
MLNRRQRKRKKDQRERDRERERERGLRKCKKVLLNESKRDQVETESGNRKG